MNNKKKKEYFDYDNSKLTQLIKQTEKKSLLTAKTGDIFFLDTLKGNPNKHGFTHEFRPVIIILGEDIVNNPLRLKFRNMPKSKTEIEQSIFAIPETTTHHKYIYIHHHKAINYRHKYDIKLDNEITLTYKGGNLFVYTNNIPEPNGHHQGYIRPENIYRFTSSERQQMINYHNQQRAKELPDTLLQNHYLGHVDDFKLDLILLFMNYKLTEQNKEIANSIENPNFKVNMNRNDTILKLKIEDDQILKDIRLQQPAHNDPDKIIKPINHTEYPKLTDNSNKDNNPDLEL